MKEQITVAVYGAAGHTGRFVVEELKRRGHGVVRVGRDAARLAENAAQDQTPWRVASIDAPEQLDAALRGTHAVINCAGPFLDTALPIADAALRAGIPYLDVTAEQPAFQSLVDQRDAQARAAGVTVIPAAAFYGGLADLLVTAAADPQASIDRVDIAVGLDSWRPTRGTRVTGERNRATRMIQRGAKLTALPQPAQEAVWSFGEAMETQEVVMLPFTEVLTVSRHLRADTIESWFAESALRELRDPNTPAPEASDEFGRSAQQFVMDVVVAQNGTMRRLVATGRDIYAVSAPIVVEAAERLLSGKSSAKGGVVSLGEVFDAGDFLSALDTVAVTRRTVAEPALRTKD